MLEHFFTTRSACAYDFLAHTQHALKIQKLRISAPVFKINYFSTVPEEPTQIGLIDVKNKGSKISHYGTFKRYRPKKLFKDYEKRTYLGLLAIVYFFMFT